MDHVDFLALLAERGIAHDASVREIAARHGVSRSTYYDWEVVRLHDARPLVEGQVEPPDFIPRLLSDLLPPPHFSAFVALDPDARTNHARALEILTRLLGEPVEAPTSNTLAHRWTFGTAFLSLMSWPPELPPNASLSNPTWERHPEMKAFGHLGFAAGHRVPLDDQESEWMASARPLAHAPGVVAVSAPPLSSDTWRGDGSFRRLPPLLATRQGLVGWSDDSGAFVGMDGESAFVVRREDIVGVELARSSGARSAAATLTLRYRDPCSSSRLERTKNVLTGRQMSSLDTLAEVVADRAEKPLEISDQPYD